MKAKEGEVVTQKTIGSKVKEGVGQLANKSTMFWKLQFGPLRKFYWLTHMVNMRILKLHVILSFLGDFQMLSNLLKSN